MIRYQVHPSLISPKIDFLLKNFTDTSHPRLNSEKSEDKHFKEDVDVRMTLVLVKSQVKHLNHS